MSGRKVIVALCVLVPLASALLVHAVRSRSRTGDSSAAQETQPTEPRRPAWTSQELREYLNSK